MITNPEHHFLDGAEYVYTIEKYASGSWFQRLICWWTIQHLWDTHLGETFKCRRCGIVLRIRKVEYEKRAEM